MQKLYAVKIFSLLLICVLFLSLFSTLGSTTYHAFFAEDSFQEGTMIGPVDISGLTEKDARIAILAEIEAWYDMGQISLVTGDKNYVLNKRETYRFDVLESVRTAVHGTQNPLIAGFKENEVERVIQDFSSVSIQDFKSDELKDELLQPATTLHPGELAFNLEQFVKVDEQNIVSNTIIKNLKDESEILNWVKEFGTIHLDSNKPFSLLTFLSEKDVSKKYSNQTLSVIATAIYSTVLPTNFAIIERHISNELPYYTTFGNEAMIEKETKDLIVYNDNPYEYKFVFSLTDEGFEVQLVGADLRQTIEISIKDEESFAPKIIKQYDSKLPKGKTVEKQKGIAGQSGKIYRVIKETGQVDQKVLVAEDYYPPIHTIELNSIIVPEVIENPIDSDPNTTNPNIDTDPNNPQTNEGTTGRSESDNPNADSENELDENKDNPKTDLWEDPDPLHEIKS
ncbi:G5 domain-containing protein [Ferdinandcohnia sp. Marseille-Q9671]